MITRRVAFKAPASTGAAPAASKVEMQLIVNGREREIEAGQDLLDLLHSLDVDSRLVIVEHNGRILRPSELEGVDLASGDRVEIVHFVGGG